MDEADRLYGLPLDEFTSARDAAAAERKAAGDPEGADAIRALKKPTLAAWAVNQVARGHPQTVSELFDATDTIRSEQRRLMAGKKSGGLRDATDARNTVVSKLVRLARDVLGDGGHAASASTLAGVSDSFMAVASDREGAELVRAGRLVRPLTPGSVVDVGPLSLVEDLEDEAEPDAPAPEDARLRAALEAAERVAKQATKVAWEADARAELAAQAASTAEREARAAREAAEFAKRAAEARRTEADEADMAVAEARAALKRGGR